MAGQPIPIGSIRTDVVDEVRDIDNETVETYQEEMEAKAEFPEICVVKEGEIYWLWDGRHRLEALRRMGRKTVWSQITIGTRDTAIERAASANRIHGLRRTRAGVRKIIENLLRHPVFGKKSDVELAEIVKCGRKLVAKVYNEFLKTTEGAVEDDEKVPEDYQNTVYDSAKAESNGQKTTALAMRRDTVKQKSATGKVYERKRKGGTKTPPEQVTVSRVAPKNEDVPRETIVDEDGVEVPDELRPGFLARDEMRAWTNALTAVKKQVHQQAEANPLGWSQFPMQKFDAMLSEWREIFLGSRIALICPKCGGVGSETCRICRGRMVVTEYQLAQRGTVPAELRNLNRKAKGLQPVDDGNQKVRR